MINPLLSEAIASLLRSVLKIGAGYLVARGVWTAEDATAYVGAAALALVGFGWSYWTTYQSRRKLVTALASTQPISEQTLKMRIDSGAFPVPRVTTPASVVPVPVMPSKD